VTDATTLPIERRRVCFVLPSLAGGGAERAAVQVLNGLDDRRWERTMYLLAREGPYLADVAAGVALASGDATSRVGRWAQLRRHLRATRPDVVVAFLSYFTALTAARAAWAGVKVVFNLQTPMSAFLDDGDYHWRRPWSRAGFAAVTRIGYRAADLVVVTSRGVAADLTARFGVAEERTRVLPNPVDIARLRTVIGEPLDPAHQARWQGPVIVAAGRLAEAKNYPLLIEALALLRRRLPARAFILGQGELEPALRRLTAARGLDDDVTFCGFQANPWKYIAKADVFAMTSRYEGFGNVLVEAFACGVPVVATASPGSRDVVTHGVDGLLVEDHAPEAMASALEQVMSDRTTRDRMAAAARRSAERFALPAVARAYDEVLGDLWT
jgi:glycosyltransferase involved in cell wall biosynthesis